MEDADEAGEAWLDTTEAAMEAVEATTSMHDHTTEIINCGCGIMEEEGLMLQVLRVGMAGGVESDSIMKNARLFICRGSYKTRFFYLL